MSSIKAKFRILEQEPIKALFKVNAVIPADDIQEQLNNEVSRAKQAESQLQGQINGITSDIDDISEELTTKADKSNTYTKSQSNELLNQKANQLALEVTNNNLDALTGDVENIAGELDNKVDKNNVFTKQETNHLLNLKQNIINDLENIRINAETGANLSTQVANNSSNIAYLDGKIRDIELFKTPNVLIQGDPTINNGQVSNFTKTNYLILPFEFDVKDRAFELTYAFRTGNDITTPQNLFGSKFSIASYIQNGKLTIRISSNGTSWDILDLATNLNIQANTTYYIKLIFNKLNYTVKSSADGIEYSQIGYVVDTRSPFAEDVFIGIGNNQNNPFLGMINLHKWELKYNNSVFWEGMDDAGLATRADISLSNLDEQGLAKFNEKVGFTDWAGGGTGGVVKTSGTYAITTSSNGYLQATTKTKEQYDSLSSSGFISKGTLENIKDDLVTSIGDNRYATKEYIDSLNANGVSY